METTNISGSLADATSAKRKKLILASAVLALCASQAVMDGPFDISELAVDVAGSRMDAPGTGNCVELDDFGTAACAIQRVKSLAQFASTDTEDLMSGSEPEVDQEDHGEISLEVLFAGFEQGEALASGPAVPSTRGTHQPESAVPWASGPSSTSRYASLDPGFSGGGFSSGGSLGGSSGSSPAVETVPADDQIAEEESPIEQPRKIASSGTNRAASDDSEKEKEIDKDEPDTEDSPVFQAAKDPDPENEDNPEGDPEDHPEGDCESDAGSDSDECSTTDQIEEELPEDDTNTPVAPPSDEAEDEGSEEEGTEEPACTDCAVVDDETDEGGPDEGEGDTGETPADHIPTSDEIPPVTPPFVLGGDDEDDDTTTGSDPAASDVPVPSTLALLLLAAFGLRYRKRAVR